MTEEEKKAAEEASRNELLTAVKEAAKEEVSQLLEAYKNESDISGLQGLIEEKATAEEVESIKTIIEDVHTQLKTIEEKGGSPEDPDFGHISEEIRGKSEDIQKLHSEKAGNVHIELKAFSLADSFNPDFDTFVEPQFKPGISRTPDKRERFNILDYITTGRAFSEEIRWIEEDTETGDAQIVDECVDKPDVSKDWVRNSTKVKKIADFTRICDEVLEYVEWAEQEIRRFLRKLVFVEMQDQILNGDGIAPNLLGITPQASAFVAGSKAASVFNANRYDAILAAVSQVNCLGFSATHVLMNCEDFFHLDTTKDNDGQYLTRNLGGVIPVDCPFIPVGSFLVGEFPLANADFKRDISIDMGLNGDDFRKNAVSMRGEVWLATYVPSNHTAAFVFDTFANVIGLIDKP